MPAARIICTTKLDPEFFLPLDGYAIEMPELGSGATLERETVLALADGAVAIVSQGELRVDEDLLGRAPGLRIVANIARGFDNLDLDAMTRRGVWGTNVPDAFTAPTAEVALGLILMVTRKLAESAQFVRDGQWTSFEPGRWDGQTLVGKTLGLIGFGKIGQATAVRAAGFGLRVIYHQRTRIAHPDAEWAPLDDLLGTSDIVSLHVPATPQTRHLVNDQTLALVKPGAILINTARGVVVDEAALLRALESGRLGGAGLDVTEFEPRVEEALRRQPNVVITPHLGGGTVESRRAARLHAIANVAEVLAGRPPLSPLNTVGTLKR
jgi:glyoxylate reductase